MRLLLEGVGFVVIYWTQLANDIFHLGEKKTDCTVVLRGNMHRHSIFIALLRGTVVGEHTFKEFSHLPS